MDKNIPEIPDRQPQQKPGKRGGIFIVLSLVVAFVLFNQHEPVNTVDCTPEIMARKPDVIMLGAWWCSYCYQAKRYFQKNDIDYCEYDMENTEAGRQLYNDSGGGAIPVMLIGEYRLQGFDEAQIEAALGLLKSTVVN